MKRILVLAVVVLFCAAPSTRAEILFESGTLGPTGVAWNELATGVVPGTVVDKFVFPGVRFQLMQPAVTSTIGGHFVEESSGTFFGAIVALDGANDFPDSVDLSSNDVLGHTQLSFPNPSAEVFGSLTLNLDPGWYALVFGSGLFETNGSGGAVRNGADIDDPSYIAYEINGPNWFNLTNFGTFFDNHRFVIEGRLVPEPAAIQFFFSAILLAMFRRRRKHIRLEE